MRLDSQATELVFVRRVHLDRAARVGTVYRVSHRRALREAAR